MAFGNINIGIKECSKCEYNLRCNECTKEVVLCRDCKHNADNGGECDRTITHTSRDDVCEVNTYKYIGLEFCSYGERIEK